MMPLMGGIAWLWKLAAFLIVVGLVAAIVAAFGGSATDGDDALRILRALDQRDFQPLTRTLGAGKQDLIRCAPERFQYTAGSRPAEESYDQVVNTMAGGRPTGVERADAINIRIPVEGAWEALKSGVSA